VRGAQGSSRASAAAPVTTGAGLPAPHQRGRGGRLQRGGSAARVAQVKQLHAPIGAARQQQRRRARGRQALHRRACLHRLRARPRMSGTRDAPRLSPAKIGKRCMRGSTSSLGARRLHTHHGNASEVLAFEARIASHSARALAAPTRGPSCMACTGLMCLLHCPMPSWSTLRPRSCTGIALTYFQLCLWTLDSDGRWSSTRRRRAPAPGSAPAPGPSSGWRPARRRRRRTARRSRRSTRRPRAPRPPTRTSPARRAPPARRGCCQRLPGAPTLASHPGDFRLVHNSEASCRCNQSIHKYQRLRTMAVSHVTALP
jgi:hypothetical protein